MKTNLAANLRKKIRVVKDFPKKGILFQDITSITDDAKLLRQVVKSISQYVKKNKFTKIAAVEARGFIFGAPLAYMLGIPFVPVRKPGKLPREVLRQSYQLEYGEDILEIHTDSICKGDKVLLVEDLLATGGTIEATAKLVQQLGGHASDAAFVVSLPELGGEKRIEAMGINILKLVEFEGE